MGIQKCYIVIVVQSLNRVRLFAIPSFTISRSFPKLMSTVLAMLSNHFILCCPLLLPSIFSSIRVFSKAMALLIRWPQYLSFSFSISSSSECSGFISFKIDCFDFLAVQGKLKSLVIHDGRKSLCIKNRDRGIKGHVFISCKNTKITTSC